MRPSPGHEHHLGPVVERAALPPRRGGRGTPRTPPARRRGRLRTCATDLLRRRRRDRDRARPAGARRGADARASPSRAAPARASARAASVVEHVVGVVEVEDHPLRRAQRAADRRQHDLRQARAAPRRAGPASGRRPAPAGRAGTSARYSSIRPTTCTSRAWHSSASSPQTTRPWCASVRPMALEPESGPTMPLDRPRQRKAGPDVRHVDDLALEQLAHQPLRRRRR